MTSLNLSGNDLYKKTGAELAEAFAGIPTAVTSLDLSRNSLGYQLAPELKLVLGAIPPTVISLDLSDNSLEHKTVPELAEALASIPESVTSVKLGWDNHKRASSAIKWLSEHLAQKDKGKVEVEKILRALTLDELKALHLIHFEGVKNLMTTCHGLHNPLSDMVSTTKKGISGLTGQFPEENDR